MFEALMSYFICRRHRFDAIDARNRKETADLLGWPVGFTSSDLYRPMINIMLGASYLARQREYFGGDSFAALAAY